MHKENFKKTSLLLVLLISLQSNLFCGKSKSAAANKRKIEQIQKGKRKIEEIQNEVKHVEGSAFLGVIKISQTSTPSLYKVAKKLADKMQIPVPTLFVTTGIIAEEKNNFIYDNVLYPILSVPQDFLLKTNAYSISTIQSLGITVIGREVVLSLSLDELICLLAQQFTRIKNYNGIKAIIAQPFTNILNTALARGTAIALNSSVPLSVFPDIFFNLFRRHQVNQSDLKAALTTKNPKALASAIEKIYDIKRTRHKYIMFFEENVVERFFWLLLSRPTLKARIAALRS